MVGVTLLISLIAFIVVLVFFSRSALVPWLDDMRRINAGKRFSGEWIAPGEIMETVARHYREYTKYSIDTLLKGWVVYARDLDRYLTGQFLESQRTRLDARLRRDDLRLIDILRCDHRIRVRHFSEDGLTCLLLDYQTERRLATYHYWSRRRVHTQSLEDTIAVYRMRYANGRWRIAEFIQELPACFGAELIEGPLDTLQMSLPPYAGRDQ